MNLLSDNIVKEWNLKSLAPKEQREAVSRIGKMIYQAVLVKSLDILSEREEEELDKLLDVDTTTPEDVMTFLKAKIPTFEQLVLEERQSLKDNLLVGVKFL